MHGGPPPASRGESETALQRLVGADHHLTLAAEYRDRLAAAVGVRVHPWSLGRALKRLKLTRKKKTRRAAERDQAAIDRGGARELA